ncbi:MAG: glutaminyl-peptide cyclotransferase, partial [Bacteroidota bacterium]
MNRLYFWCIICIFFTVACNNNSENKTATTAADTDRTTGLIPYTLIKSFPHDTNSFTEGLLVHNGKLLESTGHTDSYEKSRSLFGVLDTVSGKIDIKAEIDKEKYFGEGIVVFKDKIYQLTETNEIGFVYDAVTYKKLGEVKYKGDGWALTTDGTTIMMSNGSSNIIYRDAATFAPVKTLNVTDDNGPVSNINELEFINGFIYANEWLTNYILKIDTSTGRVVGKLDLSALAADAKAIYAGAIEMNGIAFDA